ncbi:altronate dehydratase family protein [Bremerella cremea]|uniref:UxaA family hydrolase n=1 Tax=Bremerella cremea TaxID=1031537 RepID=UPI0031EDB8F1
MLDENFSSQLVRLDNFDNVAVARTVIPAKAVLHSLEGEVVALNAIPAGHKVAIQAIAQGETVVKYGQIIGQATCDIAAGEHVHSHNLAMIDVHADYAPSSAVPPAPEPIEGRTFEGYVRTNGKVGTRNYLAVISTVNCSASVARFIAERFPQEELAKYPNVDGIIAMKHGAGCGMQFGGEAHQTLNRLMAGMAQHPNVGGFLLVGLGCETGAMGYLLQQHNLVQIDGVGGADRPGPLVLSMQDMGGTMQTIEAGIAQIRTMLPQVNDIQRQTVSASHLCVGLECGGSDGNSGVTANPALGIASDRIVACGGTAILSETSEVYGAEHLLTRRAVTPEIADKLIERIEWWKKYVAMFGVELDNNPSPGNKAGGLTTIAEKSLGAVAKAGSTALVDVYHYAEPVEAKGLVLMDTPGYDPASVTGMVAGGANVICFTTGRGSCFGCKPTPSIKIATNTPMYDRMISDMDINAGTVLEGESITEAGERIFEEILAVASGKKTKSEQQGIGDEEFVPWLVGPTL